MTISPGGEGREILNPSLDWVIHWDSCPRVKPTGEDQGIGFRILNATGPAVTKTIRNRKNGIGFWTLNTYYVAYFRLKPGFWLPSVVTKVDVFVVSSPPEVCSNPPMRNVPSPSKVQETWKYLSSSREWDFSQVPVPEFHCVQFKPPHRRPLSAVCANLLSGNWGSVQDTPVNGLYNSV